MPQAELCRLRSGGLVLGRQVQKLKVPAASSLTLWAFAFPATPSYLGSSLQAQTET